MVSFRDDSFLTSGSDYIDPVVADARFEGKVKIEINLLPYSKNWRSSNAKDILGKSKLFNHENNREDNGQTFLMLNFLRGYYSSSEHFCKKMQKQYEKCAKDG